MPAVQVEHDAQAKSVNNFEDQTRGSRIRAAPFYLEQECSDYHDKLSERR